MQFARIKTPDENLIWFNLYNVKLSLGVRKSQEWCLFQSVYLAFQTQLKLIYEFQVTKGLL